MNNIALDAENHSNHGEKQKKKDLFEEQEPMTTMNIMSRSQSNERRSLTMKELDGLIQLKPEVIRNYCWRIEEYRDLFTPDTTPAFIEKIQEWIYNKLKPWGKAQEEFETEFYFLPLVKCEFVEENSVCIHVQHFKGKVNYIVSLFSWRVSGQRYLRIVLLVLAHNNITYLPLSVATVGFGLMTVISLGAGIGGNIIAASAHVGLETTDKKNLERRMHDYCSRFDVFQGDHKLILE